MKTPTYQPHERPPSVTVKSDLPPSWWVGKTREEFNAEIAARHNAMREAKENRFVPFRTLQ
jgi:hypothetical protein